MNANEVDYDQIGSILLRHCSLRMAEQHVTAIRKEIEDGRSPGAACEHVLGGGNNEAALATEPIRSWVAEGIKAWKQAAGEPTSGYLQQVPVPGEKLNPFDVGAQVLVPPLPSTHDRGLPERFTKHLHEAIRRHVRPPLPAERFPWDEETPKERLQQLMTEPQQRIEQDTEKWHIEAMSPFPGLGPNAKGMRLKGRWTSLSLSRGDAIELMEALATGLALMERLK